MGDVGVVHQGIVHGVLHGVLVHVSRCGHWNGSHLRLHLEGLLAVRLGNNGLEGSLELLLLKLTLSIMTPSGFEFAAFDSVVFEDDNHCCC